MRSRSFASVFQPTLAAVSFVLGALLLIPACSDDDSSSSNPGGSSGPTFEELTPQLISAICDAQTACVGSLSEVFGGTDCKTQVTAQFNEASLPTLKADIDAGKATYDGSKAAACLSEIKSLGCSLQVSRITDLASCQGLLVGKTAMGGDCTSDSQCAQGHYCKVASACPGKCSPREAEGSACVSDDDCASGLTCDSAQGSRKCSKPVASGGSCGSTTPGCVAGTLCVGADSNNGATGTCKAYAELFSAGAGAACDLTKFQLCQAGQVCQLDKLDASGASFSCAAKVASGAACKVAIPEACPTGEYCEGIDLQASPPKAEGTCKKIPGAGEACGKPFQGSGCMEGLFCATDGKCKAPGKNGAACTTPQDCLSQHCASGACVAEDACNDK